MNFRYSDVIADVAEYIYVQRIQDSYYTTDMVNTIALLDPQHRTINSVLRLLSDRLHCTLLLSDRYLVRKGSAAWPTSTQWDYSALLQELKKSKGRVKNQTAMEFEEKQFTLWYIPVPSNVHRGMHLFALDEFDQMTAERFQQAVDVVALFLNIWDKGTYYDGTDALVEAILTDDPVKMRKLALQMGISIGAVNTMWVLQITDSEKRQELTVSQKLDVILKLKLHLQDHHKITIVDSYGPHIVALTDGVILDEDPRELGEAFVAELERAGYDARTCLFKDLNNTAEMRDAYNRVVACFPELLPSIANGTYTRTMMYILCRLAWTTSGRTGRKH